MVETGAVPAALTGRTIGKAMRRLSLRQEDAVTPAGWKASFMRYGLIVVVAYALSLFVGPLAPVVVLFGVTMWMRNPNMQGLHDRMAHTLVVSDEKG